MNMKHILSAILVSATMMASVSAMAGQEDQRYYQQNKAHLITKQKAVAIAKQHVKGATLRKAEFDYDSDTGGAYYDVDLIKNGQKYDVKVDAKTGTVVKAELDD